MQNILDIVSIVIAGITFTVKKFADPNACEINIDGYLTKKGEKLIHDYLLGSGNIDVDMLNVKYDVVEFFVLSDLNGFLDGFFGYIRSIVGAVEMKKEVVAILRLGEGLMFVIETKYITNTEIFKYVGSTTKIYMTNDAENSGEFPYESGYDAKRNVFRGSGEEHLFHNSTLFIPSRHGFAKFTCGGNIIELEKVPESEWLGIMKRVGIKN